MDSLQEPSGQKNEGQIWEKPNRTPTKADATDLSRKELLAELEQLKRSHQQIGSLEEQYRITFENQPQPMWVVDGETLRFVAVNDAAIKLYGYSREEFLAFTLFDIRPAEDRPTLEDYCQKMEEHPVLAKGGFSDVWKHQKKDGTLIDVEVTWSVLNFKDQRCILSLLKDVTENKEMGEQPTLQDSALSQLTEAVFATDNAHRITYWNQAAERLLGYSPDEVIGRTADEATGDRFLTEKDEEASRNGLRDFGFWRGEKVLHSKSGEGIYADTSLTTLKNDNGAVIGRLAVIRDVSEAKQIQQQLVESNEKLEAIIYASPVAIVLTDLAGEIKIWNLAAEKTFGWPAEEMVAQPYEKLVPQELLSQHQTLWKELISGKVLAGRELRRQCRDGRIIDVITSKAPVHDIHGNVIGIVNVLNDITERKRTERELRSAKEAADSANRTKTEFVANISHEIRTPLAAILGFAEMMFDAKQTVSERMTCITRIRQNVKNLTALIDDLLDLSRVEAGKFELVRSEFALLPELADVTTVLQSQVLRKGLGLKILFEGSIPRNITSDATRLRQILVNIVGNAIKFTDRGTVTLTVQLENSSQSAPVLAFSVKDTGPGISRDQVQTIFQPFAQIDSSTTRRYGGTGLGLNLSRRLARILGGNVRLEESIPGIGSTFLITIDPGPIDESDLMEDVTQADLRSKKMKPVSMEKHRLDGMRILLVEDGKDNQFLISHFLKSSGANVELAENGIDGINMVTKNPYDLILMDIQMPMLDGYKATSHLRREGCRLPIVALTAHAMKEERQRCYRVGCNDYLSKPVAMNTLVEMVHRYCPEKTKPAQPTIH